MYHITGAISACLTLAHAGNQLGPAALVQRMISALGMNQITTDKK
jgi:hypothetical protein